MGLTPSCPLASCRLTACSSCCSSLTVWFSPAVIFSFLSISSCQRHNEWFRAQCMHLTDTHAKTQTAPDSLSVMKDCCSLSGHQRCPSLLRAPPESDQETAGPVRRTRKFHLLLIQLRVRPISEVEQNIQISITLYKSPATFCLSFSSVSSLDRVSVSWVFSWNHNRHSAQFVQHIIAS